MQDTSKELLQAILNDDVSAIRKLLKGAPAENLNAIDKVVAINQYVYAACILYACPCTCVQIHLLYQMCDAIWYYVYYRVSSLAL